MVKKAHGNDTVDITVEIKHETEKAWLVSDGSSEVWIAKSQGEMERSANKKIYTLTIPEWLASDKGLI